jgi:hypothetical protein
MNSLKEYKNFGAFCAYFKDEETCRKYLAKVRWKGNPICPFCKSPKGAWEYKARL